MWVGCIKPVYEDNHTMSDAVAKHLNPGITDPAFRRTVAELVSQLPAVLEANEADAAIAYGELAEIFPELAATALRELGHRVDLAED